MKVSYFFVLWEAPLVCVISAGRSLTSGIELALEYAAGRPCHILARASWDLAVIGEAIASAHRWLSETHPEARLVAMAPTAADADYMTGLGVASLHAHNCAFISERIYFPEPGAAKTFDAVHNAQTKPFKRHELALGVRNLALITYDEPEATDAVADLVARYRHLAYANYSAAAGCRTLSGAEVRKVVSAARCGLALSETEGPNNASMEYFLSGVPLVSTPSRGGREAMYDPRHVAIVAPTRMAVERAVAAFRRRAPDPQEIRAAALARSRPHRARLIAWLSDIVGRDLAGDADENLWLPQFTDKLRQTWRVEVGPDGRIRAQEPIDWTGWQTGPAGAESAAHQGAIDPAIR